MKAIYYLIVILLFGSCNEKKDEVEIYLTKSRVATHEGVPINDTLLNSPKLKGLFKRFDSKKVNFDLQNGDIIFAGAFDVIKKDLEDEPIVANEEIDNFNTEKSEIILSESASKKIAEIDWKKDGYFGRQFAICINRKPVLTGYFYSSLSSYLPTTYFIFIDEKNQVEVSSERIFEYPIYFGKELKRANIDAKK